MTTVNYDIVIIGGGPVGMALALVLRDSGVATLLLEARGLPEKVDDPRPLALSHGSRLILQRLNVWQKLTQKTPISSIHISNRGGLGRTVLTPEDAGVSALGYVVHYHDLFRAMHETLQDIDTVYLTGASVKQFDTDTDFGTVQFDHDGEQKRANAKLLVLADGGHLSAQIEDITYQIHDYEQWAVVANIKAETLQSGIAYERFTANGPIALLPSGEDYALVWTVSPTAAKEILALDDETFLARLHQHFGDRLGKFINAGKRSGFPLTLKYATPTTSQRIALVGNAAQTLHPVAGQGFNLGLRDAYELANEVLMTFKSCKEIGTPAMLTRYRQQRQIDSNAGRLFTDSLIKLFSNDNPLLKHACGFGLSTLDCFPPIKRFVARRMIFGARG